MKQTDEMNLQNLRQAIEQQRQLMLETANVYGMGNDKTIRVSRELDEFILEYQKATTAKGETNDVKWND
ncbi:aspartyl-phosphate phosphatase Spo0E family protein [Lentibacillus cibarius]|nr:aspartyl-phosphate phosphatase Spo0E family protein [Lentibacillus cibarius]